MADVPLGNAEVKDAELDLAVKLVDQIASDRFEPQRYEDAVRKRTMEQIQKKIQGQEITAPPAEAPRAQVIDLMQALKASLQATPAPERKPAQRAPRAATAQKTKASR